MIRKNSCNKRKITSKGMTLLEVLIAVSIIAIFAAVVYPSLNDYVYKGHRKQAMADMIRIQLTMEQTYNNGYSWSNLVSGSTCTICDTSADRYAFAITSASVYTITATPKPDKGQNSDSCGTLTIKAYGTNTPAMCW
ncbi:prepilin-type N-terminal cleavage/methylation domain-containing protein [Vibrio sp. S9_S30]|uniref:type IV pilin protein n=1 Tax=Vibrio sp. S9_S30 TaxID=2720226 RepID=UPI001681740B|nr:type IV pilin protein [Vibrio sp. S9_S30]MBD1555904.1 prepilin-type N-terminal cleavage/methylation domain-containing protein [Vibrio sp. S9_S30]